MKEFNATKLLVAPFILWLLFFFAITTIAFSGTIMLEITTINWLLASSLILVIIVSLARLCIFFAQKRISESAVFEEDPVSSRILRCNVLFPRKSIRHREPSFEERATRWLGSFFFFPALFGKRKTS